MESHLQPLYIFSKRYQLLFTSGLMLEKSMSTELMKVVRQTPTPLWLPVRVHYPASPSVFLVSFTKRDGKVTAPVGNTTQEGRHALTQQEIHLEAHAHVFPDLEERVAWEVAGYMIACWLALQSDVECVEYHFAEVARTQNITKDNMDTSVVEFLEYQTGVLEGR